MVLVKVRILLSSWACIIPFLRICSKELRMITFTSLLGNTLLQMDRTSIIKDTSPVSVVTVTESKM